MKGNRNHQQGDNSMNIQDRQLIAETLGEMRELRGEMREFKEHVMGRVVKLEKMESDRSKEKFSIMSLITALLALIVNFVFNLFKVGK